jgi:serine/threonine protein kinase
VAAAVGRYELVRAIGRGGMAEVFLARRRGAAGIAKRLVVKRVRQDLTSDPRFAEMFLREARVSTALSHKNIVTVFDVGRDEDGLFLAMDYVDGPDLATALDKAGTLDPLMAAYIASEVAAGLDYAHRYRDEKGVALGLVHRDVTPRNILLSLDGEVKVTDFGVAVLGGDPSEHRRGTPQYMSPEQARGESIDPRADVFSLGLVLHELLAGERVYRGGDKDEIVRKARSAEIPRLGPEVPSALADLVARATAARPDDRFASARAMQRELEAWVLAERARLSQPDPPEHALAELLAALFPDWSDRTSEEALRGSAGDAGTATMQSVAETVGLDPATASRVQNLAQLHAARSSQSTPRVRSRRRAAIALGVIAIAGVALALGIGAARRDEPETARASLPVEPAVPMSVPDAAAEPIPMAPADAAPVVEAAPDAGAAKKKKNGSSTSTSSSTKEQGTLDLNAVPWAYVSVDGGPEEETPIKGRRLAPGKHRVLIRNPVLERQRTMTIEILPGETSRHVVDLRQ